MNKVLQKYSFQNNETILAKDGIILRSSTNSEQINSFDGQNNNTMNEVMINKTQHSFKFIDE